MAIGGWSIFLREMLVEVRGVEPGLSKAPSDGILKGSHDMCSTLDPSAVRAYEAKARAETKARRRRTQEDVEHSQATLMLNNQDTR